LGVFGLGYTLEELSEKFELKRYLSDILFGPLLPKQTLLTPEQQSSTSNKDMVFEVYELANFLISEEVCIEGF
jgi:hypothetical protein